MLAFVRRLLPLLVAVGALLIAVRGTDLHKLQAAMEHAPMALLLVVSAGMAVLNCAADTLAMFYVFRWFGLHLRFFDLYTIRAATYTLAVINYHAGQLGIIGYLHRAGRVALPRASAYILFIVGVWVALLLLFAGGSLLLGGEKARAMAPLLSVFLIGLVVYALLLRWPPKFLLHEPAMPSAEGEGESEGEGGAGAGGESAVVRLGKRVWYRAWRILSKLWAPLMEAGIKGHLRAMGVRLPHLAVLLVWHFIALRCFNVIVPVHVAVLYLPVVFAVASLPISVQGLGTSQVAAKYFFTEFAAAGEESVLAYSLSMTAISTASNLIMGLLFLGRGTRLGLAEMAESAARELDSGEASAG